MDVITLVMKTMEMASEMTMIGKGSTCFHDS